MDIERVLLVVKKTALRRLEDDSDPGAQRMLRLMERADVTVHGIRGAHDEHMESLRTVRSILRVLGIDFREQPNLPKRLIDAYDLVIPVGGDGTVLGVSHFVRNDTPVLGVNSAPTFSVGYLTGTLAEGLEEKLGHLASGTVAPLRLQRLQVQLGKKVLPIPVLNDALFCCNNPAAVSRYLLGWPDGEELQRSSGVWVSTPAGSTGAMNSAGGPILPLTATQFAFLVREPCAPPGNAVRVRSAVLAREDEVIIESRIKDASVFLDGSRWKFPVPYGERVRFGLHPQPLRLVRALHGAWVGPSPAQTQPPI